MYNGSYIFFWPWDWDIVKQWGYEKIIVHSTLVCISQIYKYSRNNSVVYLLLLLTIQTSAVQTEWHPELRSEPKTFEAFLILTGARGIIKMEAHGTIHMELEIQETFKEYLFAGEGWVEAQLKGLH